MFSTVRRCRVRRQVAEPAEEDLLSAQADETPARVGQEEGLWAVPLGVVHDSCQRGLLQALGSR